MFLLDSRSACSRKYEAALKASPAHIVFSTWSIDPACRALPAADNPISTHTALMQSGGIAIHRLRGNTFGKQSSDIAVHHKEKPGRGGRWIFAFRVIVCIARTASDKPILHTMTAAVAFHLVRRNY